MKKQAKIEKNNVITADAPVNVGTHNESAHADVSLAPKAGQKPADAKVAPVTKRAPKEIPADALKKAEKADAARAEWLLITGLHQQGLDRPAIAKQAGVPYSRVTFVLWHLQYGLAGIPGMPEYTKEAKAEAQKRYLADVETRKQAKANG